MSKAYEQAGVNIEAGYEGVKRMSRHVASTMRPEVIGSLGGFGGMFDLTKTGFREPVLVSGTDGVGTKLMIAQQMNRHDTIGIDCVAMCVNDVLVQGAEPLFFLDYLALGKNDPNVVEQLVAGVSEGCRQAGAALIGGETAEMPGMYDPDEYDMAGFVVGCAEKSRIWGAERIQAGDQLIALSSSGIHSNGYSLVRKLIDDAGLSWNDPAPWSPEASVGDSLLTPTRIYTKAFKPFFGSELIHGASHITGGGLIENVPRMLPEHLSAEIDLSSWKLPAVFTWLKEAGNLKQEDLLSTFNTGCGMILAVAKENVQEVLETLKVQGETPWLIGDVTAKTEIESEPLTLKGDWLS
ncbi:phosphoribosylformylglycinamidine cyclo-ligase [Salisediminibacterium beveridgei]|uniref:Phosphoribosylformylglycinamidine cyclo-ligase n=1 Tax=Salisediminibacterium beveridgei TaxID=632773 RepID=A0A1D7QY82_9BACI|nr:phosphoribosylformylglycinamidine cyclo-ligase [Salisediminibacterium beveridgei]AOM83961.1 Phosphoribosylformylglycinamidine cyclo-ligase [Salisediminibacterium beveridgei]